MNSTATKEGIFGKRGIFGINTQNIKFPWKLTSEVRSNFCKLIVKKIEIYHHICTNNVKINKTFK